MARSCEWETLEGFRDICKATRFQTIQGLRPIFRDRYLALVNQLHHWKTLPIDNPFEFPSPCGPMPLTWVDMTAGRRDVNLRFVNLGLMY